MEIVNMQTLKPSQRTQAARMLADELPLGWPTLADAEQNSMSTDFHGRERALRIR